VEVITGAALIAEDQASMGELLAGMRAIIVVFGFVAVFVGAFIINNTFSITVAQRTREMAVLRALGASGRQVKRSVLLEAVVVGVLASGAGLALGIGVASGLRRMMSAFGFDMPPGATVIEPNALIVSFVVGLVVTVVSAWLPARRAAKIAPIAALREVDMDRAGASVTRAVVGFLLAGAGVAAIVSGDSRVLTAVSSRRSRARSCSRRCWHGRLPPPSDSRFGSVA
jgi:putative ABC transport system permease protein